jgi:pSer/pThr/pTyr-binding forkhead associated (FHA) protein
MLSEAPSPSASPVSSADAGAPPPASLVDVRWAVAYPLARVCTGIGRDASNPVLIRDLVASRSHAEVRRDGDAYVLHPVGSGETKVNGVVATAPRPLAEGDVIEIAYTRLRFTRKPPSGDVLPAPEHPAVDSDFANRTTEIREIVTTETLQQLRRQPARPVRLGRRLLVGAVVVALAILLAMGLWLR